MKTSTKRASKLVVEITTAELFRNYAQATLDVVWERDTSDIEDTLAEPLMTIHRESEDGVRRLFNDGMTMMLLGNAFSQLDKHDVIEIIVTRRDGETFSVHHDSIQY